MGSCQYIRNSNSLLFGLALVAQAVVIAAFWLFDRMFWKRAQRLGNRDFDWKQLYVVILGTICGCLVWLPAWQGSQYHEATSWAYNYYHSNLDWLNPIRYVITGLITVVTLVPVRRPDGSILIVLTGLAICFSLWVGTKATQGLKIQFQQPAYDWSIKALAGITFGSILILCLLDYVQGSRLTSGLRYNFIYFPAAILLLAISLAPQWIRSSQKQSNLSSHPVGCSLSLGLYLRRRLLVIMIIVVATISALGVCFNFGYQKIHRPDLMAPDVKALSQASVVIAMPQHSHSEIRRLIGLAYELKDAQLSPKFYFDHQPCGDETNPSCNAATETFRQDLAKLPRPLNLWLIDFSGTTNLADQNCFFDSKLGTKRPPGFNYQLYSCSEISPKIELFRCIK